MQHRHTFIAHTYIHTYTHTYLHTDRQTDRQTDSYEDINACTHASVVGCTHMHAHAKASNVARYASRDGRNDWDCEDDGNGANYRTEHHTSSSSSSYLPEAQCSCAAWSAKPWRQHARHH